MSHHALLEETAKHIETLESKRSKLLEEVRQVEKEIGDARAEHAKLVNSTASVSVLPNEVLAAIFHLCQGTSVKMGPGSRIPFPVVASHVSTRWRNVVLGTPLLWNTINLIITPRTRNRALQRLVAHLTRSDQCLLDVSLDISTPQGIPEVLYLLTPHANRWHRISISIARGSADDIYAPFSSVAAPALIHLSLRIGRCDDDDDSPRTEYPDTCPPIITRGSPALTFVRVAGKVVGNLTPPLSAVKTFHVDAWPKNLMTLSQFRAMLEALPRLVHLSLTGLSIHLPRNPLDISEPVPLPSLRSLRIRGNSVPCHRLLSLLTLPALESLSLHNVDTFDSAVIPTVKSLTLEACDFTESELRNMFRSFPDISTLNIDASVPRIYPMLRPDAGQDPPWPQLRSIYLRQLPPADVVPFCLLVLGRVGTHAAVSSVYLDKRSRSVLNAKDFMEILRDQLLVGNCDYLPQWPADLGYEDPDDDWDWDYMR